MTKDEAKRQLDELKKTGGPAFPILVETSNGYVTVNNNGMSLRDWFAGKALQGLVSNKNLILDAHLAPDETTSSLAKVAYTLADAMLAERDKL